MARVTLPSSQKTLILAMDVSGSMRATDVKPSRIVAAQSAAKKFLETLPRDVKVGIVAFAGAAQVAQLPTLNREDLVTAIDRFQLQRGTATGNSIVISLATLFPQAGIELQQMGQPARSTARPLDAPAAPEAKPREFTPVPPGSYASAAIIMLTDGQRTTGVDPLEAAKMAADRGVRVYTVGIGTVDGETIGFEGWSMRVRLDEDTLKKDRPADPGRLFLRGHRREPDRGVRKTRQPAQCRNPRDRGQRPVRAGRRAAGAAGGRFVAAVVPPGVLSGFAPTGRFMS